jgi:pseudouridine-5'-monophosphatase
MHAIFFISILIVFDKILRIILIAACRSALHQQYFPTAKVLPGVDALLLTLRYRVDNVHMAIATSSSAANVQLKIKNLKDTFALFQPERILVGDDLRIPKGRGKPCPDIYLQSLKSINEGLKEDEKPILPIECLVLEDGIPGVTAGRRAGMRVAWVPHPDLASLIKGSEAEVLAGKGMKNNEDCYELGFAGDGWGEQLSSLQSFPFEKYGMDVRYG